ncbi:hypothetical protein COU61_03655 [Candidatus Pacearchaeota archaeon CG10_big_fil_rev_8_21_14_0_10_35_13]|nr:MAG: hypothetical protein COU61_03655 [Candidatus Pacearchaeota archaeon CG10_big_fil_rev_8_21_14_0_10_35_13]
MVIITKVKKEEFGRILKNYGLGTYRNSEHVEEALENTVYKVRSSKGLWIIKIFEETADKDIRYQQRIEQYLQEKGLPTPRTLKNKQGRKINEYKKKTLIVQECINGRKPRRKEITEELAREIGTVTGKIDRELQALRIGYRPKPKKEHQFIDRRMRKKEIEYVKKEEKLMSEMKKINRKKLRKGIIHADITRSNMLISRGKLKAVIDWGDSCEDYIAQEMAVTIAQSFIRRGRVIKSKIRAYLKGYNKEMPMNDEEKKAVYYFAKKRMIGASAWFLEQARRHEDKKEELLEWTKEMMENYDGLNKLTIKEWKKLW